jgi:hypothetical protein
MSKQGNMTPPKVNRPTITNNKDIEAGETAKNSKE